MRKFLLILLLATIIVIPALAANPRLQLAAHVAEWGGSCQPGPFNILAGSRLFLRMTNTADQPAQPLVPGWPEGYILEAALDLPKKQPFIPSSGLIERLNPIRILSEANRGAEQTLFRNPVDFRDVVNLNAKYFVMTIPADLAGHTLSFQVHFEDQGLALTSKTLGPIRIIAPCDRYDTARIISLQIYEGWQVGDITRCTELADSMLAVGLSDALAWDLAEAMARGLEDYDKALLYLQRLYEDFGVLGLELGTADPPIFNPEGIRDPKMQTGYENRRNELLRLKSEKEQQQH